MKFSFAMKKELMYFSRTFRMFGVIFSILIFALADPLLLKMMGGLLSSLTSANPEIFTAEDMSALSMFTDIDVSGMLSFAVGDFTQTAVLIVLLILVGPSGSEQKKRSIIIPQCAGLTPNMYATPKFLLYPLTAFLSGFVGLLLCAGVSSLLFEGSVDFGTLMLGAVSVGLYIAFVVVLQFTIGICSARPGVAVISVLAATSVIPALLVSFRVDKFNPFALPSIAMNAFSKASGNHMMAEAVELDPLNVGVSLIVTVILSLILYFTTLFVLTARQTDNEGNEAVL